MTQPFIGQIQPYAFNFAPKNWAFCNGQILTIQQNAALFSLLGKMYGGNGTTTFALPNLQSRVPMHTGTNIGVTYPQGEQAGTETVTILVANMPSHSHTFFGSTAVATGAILAAGDLLATSTGGSGTPDQFYATDAAPQPLNIASVQPSGNTQPHSNLQPYLAINWCISLAGIFPSRS